MAGSGILDKISRIRNTVSWYRKLTSADLVWHDVHLVQNKPQGSAQEEGQLGKFAVYIPRQAQVTVLERETTKIMYQ
jgi:hypothetical protein